MDQKQLPEDFKDFIRFLNKKASGRLQDMADIEKLENSSEPV